MNFLPLSLAFLLIQNAAPPSQSASISGSLSRRERENRSRMRPFNCLQILLF